MSQDIDQALRGWEFKPGVVQARLVDAGAPPENRQVIQMRVDLGILQLELDGRPDGTHPHGHPTYFAFLQHLAAKRKDKKPFRMNDEQCMEADREFLQFYHRRICWLALRNYDNAIRDADHTLAFMTFVNAHAPNEDYALTHEQYRGFVLFHRTQAAAALAIEKNDPEAAIDAVGQGLAGIKAFYEEHELEERIEDDLMVQQLKKIQEQIRKLHNIEATLQEQLAEAVAREEYETAARLRDALRRRNQEPRI